MHRRLAPEAHRQDAAALGGAGYLDDFAAEEAPGLQRLRVQQGDPGLAHGGQEIGLRRKAGRFRTPAAAMYLACRQLHRGSLGRTKTAREKVKREANPGVRLAHPPVTYCYVPLCFDAKSGLRLGNLGSPTGIVQRRAVPDL